MRTRTHTRTARTARTALAHWEKACTLAQKYSLKVSPIEESLMEMLHPEGNIDSHWVDNMSALLRDMVSQLTTAAAALRARVAAAGSELHARTARLHAALAERAQLAADVRAPLHALQPTHEGNNPANDYLNREKAVAELLRSVTSVQEEEASVLAAARALDALHEELPALRDALLQLPDSWSAETSGRQLSRQTTVNARPAARGGGGGERNAQGAGVWRRVRLKLEGRDHERRRAPLEQVDYIITEATNAENLCMMYEGWMSWV